MIVYHGSMSKFESFLIDESLSHHDISSLAEGYGVYLTESKKMASHYGRYIYVVEIQEKNISDFTSKQFLNNLIEKIETDVKLPISSLVDTSLMIDGVLEGEISATKMYKEINDFLDSIEKFHMDYGHLITYEDDCIYEKIKQSFNHHTTDTIKYFDKSFNHNVYICYKNPENITIKEIIEH